MNSSCRSVNSRAMASIILIVVVASLCFSVGEGLRLTPFPIAVLTGVEAGEASLTTEASCQASTHKYGPLDVPSPNQNRNKRQAAPLDFLPAANSCAIPDAVKFSVAREPSEIVSVLVMFQSAGRAPPVIS